ncbi:MAG: hypothetical protein V7631_1166 [Massilia sp.]|jgi:hypothetical protein
MILIEQRAHVRKLMHEQAFLSDPDVTSWTPVILLDISLTGISFATPGVIVGGEQRQLRFRMPGSAHLHHASIHIVHQTNAGVPVGFKVGARFDGIDAATNEAIAAFVGEPAA